jgi:hypothetical protein
MRFKNSYAAAVAAAVAAVVFSAAFQPAEAALVVIDDFNNTPVSISGSSSNVGGTSFTILSLDSTPSGNTAFTNRFAGVDITQSGGSGTRTAANFYASTSVNSGSNGLGVLTAGKNAIATGTAYPNIFQLSLFYWVGDVSNLTDTGILSVDKMRVVIAAASTSGTGVSLAGPGFTVFDVNGNTAAWTPPFAAGTYEGKFDTDFVYDVQNAPFVFDWTQVTQLNYGWERSANSSAASAPAFATSVSLDSITIVPEPTHMVSVAGIGAALGAWRLRKLRRSRTAAGDAIAG